MSTISLESCWAKIERAKEHTESLEHFARETFSIEENKPRAGIKLDSNTGEHVLYVSYMPDLSACFERVGLILGDALYNLRSSLEHLAFQLALWNTNGKIREERYVSFPIVETAEKFRKFRGLKEINPKHAAIIERFQGYHRVHENVSVGTYFHPLVKLKDLSNLDKHRSLTSAVIPSSGLSGVGTKTLWLLFLSIPHSPAFVEPVPIELETEIARAKPPDGVIQEDMDTAAYIIPTISFDDARPAIPVLNKIVDTITLLIQEIEPTLV